MLVGALVSPEASRGQEHSDVWVLLVAQGDPTVGRGQAHTGQLRGGSGSQWHLALLGLWSIF